MYVQALIYTPSVRQHVLRSWKRDTKYGKYVTTGQLFVVDYPTHTHAHKHISMLVGIFGTQSSFVLPNLPEKRKMWLWPPNMTVKFASETYIHIYKHIHTHLHILVCVNVHNSIFLLTYPLLKCAYKYFKLLYISGKYVRMCALWHATSMYFDLICMWQFDLAAHFMHKLRRQIALQDIWSLAASLRSHRQTHVHVFLCGRMLKVNSQVEENSMLIYGGINFVDADRVLGKFQTLSAIYIWSWGICER